MESPIMIKVLIETPTIHVLYAVNKVVELNNVGTVFIAGVPNTKNGSVLTVNPNKQQNQQMLSKSVQLVQQML